MALSRRVTFNKKLLLDKDLLCCLSACNFIQSAHPYSSSRNVRLTDMKRGRGGRSSFSGLVTTVFGATGFLGRSLISQLGKIGSQIIIPYRGDPYNHKELKLAGDLGQVLFLPYHLKDDVSIRKAICHSNVVINLVSKDMETSNFSFEDLHIDFPERLVKMCKEEGVEKLVHVSALNTQIEPPSFILKDGSKWLKTKAEGEDLVRREFPDAIIFRPADMFGDFDRFVSYYSSSARRFKPPVINGSLGTTAIPLWKKGRETIKQPVYVTNVSQGMVAAILDEGCVGKTFECVGPNRYRLDDLIRWMYLSMRYTNDEIKITHVWPNYKFKMWLIQKVLPKYPPISFERMEREFLTDTPSGLSTLEDLGVSLLSLEDRLPYIIKPFRRYGYFWSSLKTWPEPPLPPLQNDLELR